MPPKKALQKQRSQHSLTSEVANRQYVLSIQEGSEVFGTCCIETLPHEAPKACEIFSQFCVPGANTNEKNKGKQAVARTILFKRLSNVGIQFGENGPANPKTVPASELEAEVGAVVPDVGTLLMCRSGDFFDGGNFFICMTTDPTEHKHIGRHYVSFGRVSNGMDVLKAACEKLLGCSGPDGTIDAASCPLQISDIFPSA